ncbi:flavin reductase family protein [Sediminicola arcticus]|jgi:flavin reductase (DIM6/NTAB) family NADH-FMN oxidoreductase RutF|uniref:Flavin reductase family protein n=1 Tax=Sediminicola arcticus TaxID=1574308 RepID=A0ABV2SXQ3_9FLAO
MIHYSEEQLALLNSRFRANLITSCTGYKSSNLLATKSKEGTTNVAIFNSVVHIGSNPPMLGFILRPLTVKRNTYDNFKDSGYFTVNQIHKDIIKNAHDTSAKYESDVSEFSKTNLTEEYMNEFQAPFVKESHIKLGCRYINEYEIKENGCLLIIGEVLDVYVPEDIVHEDGWVQLDKADTAAIIGLDGYALPQLLDRFSYAKPDQKSYSLIYGS